MITLTPAAAVKVKQLLETENASELALRVAVRPGGCSGYSYEMYFDGDFTSEDKVEAFGDVKVVVDQASAQLFLNVLRDGLNADRAGSDLLIARTDLSALFPEPAADYVRARGGAG